MRPSHILKVENDWRARLATALGRELALRKEVEALRAEAGTLAQRIAEGIAENKRLFEVRNATMSINAELRAENERLRKDARAYANVMLSEENDALIEENKRLKAENARIISWLRRNANAEQHPLVRQALIEAHNAALGEQAKG